MLVIYVIYFICMLLSVKYKGFYGERNLCNIILSILKIPKNDTFRLDELGVRIM